MSTLENDTTGPASGVENAEVLSVAKEASITDKGSERYDKLSGSIKGAVAKVGSFIQKGAAPIARMFKKTAVGVLSAPEAVATAAESVKAGAVAGAEAVNEKFTQASAYVFDQADAFDAWRGEKAEQIGAWTDKKAAETREFMAKKAEKIRDFGTEKLMLAGSIASLAKNKTVEGLRSAKEAIGSRFGKLVEFGKNSVDSAILHRTEAKFKYHAEMQRRMYSAMEGKQDRQEARLAKTKSKLAAYEKFRASNTIALPNVKYSVAA